MANAIQYKGFLPFLTTVTQSYERIKMYLVYDILCQKARSDTIFTVFTVFSADILIIFCELVPSQNTKSTAKNYTLCTKNQAFFLTLNNLHKLCIFCKHLLSSIEEIFNITIEQTKSTFIEYNTDSKITNVFFFWLLFIK